MPIPTPDDLRREHDSENKLDAARTWLREDIAQFIEKHGAQLVKGQTVDYEPVPPTTRGINDGVPAVYWYDLCESLAEELEEMGYQVELIKRDALVHPQRAKMVIWLGSDD